jgi:thiol-disulfide isomerase/thioredoxin
MQLSYRRVTSFTGEIELNGKTHRTVLIENDNDAVFRANKGDAGRPMWILIDLDGDGRFSAAERFDARYAFEINGQNYLARTAAWGGRYMLMPFRGEAAPARGEGAPAAARPPVTRIPLLAAGTPAPDFVALKPDGSELRLSDYRGKTVILDFWATWCGPCIRAMPFLENLYQQSKDQDVVVLGVCVWDTKEAFDKWQVEPRVRTSFPKAFDPAGRNPDNHNADSIAKLHYNVSGIPTMYVIDRDGKVVEGILGFRGETDTRLTDALLRAGVKL